MKRFYRVVEPFAAASPSGELREFAIEILLSCDLVQDGNELKFETADGLTWLVRRQAFEQCCMLARDRL
jgi:hypothetical protein